MVGQSLGIQTIVRAIIAVAFPLLAQAQSKTDFPELEHCRKWSIVAGQVIYNRASITPQYVEYQFENLKESADSRGFSTLSGNYLGLLLSLGFNKKKEEY